MVNKTMEKPTRGKGMKVLVNFENKILKIDQC
jgi:hypothetical protein